MSARISGIDGDSSPGLRLGKEGDCGGAEMMSLAAFDVESTAMFLNESALSAFGVELGDVRLFLDRLVVLVKAAGIAGQR